MDVARKIKKLRVRMGLLWLVAVTYLNKRPDSSYRQRITHGVTVSNAGEKISLATPGDVPTFDRSIRQNLWPEFAQSPADAPSRATSSTARDRARKAAASART